MGEADTNALVSDRFLQLVYAIVHDFFLQNCPGGDVHGFDLIELTLSNSRRGH